MTKAQEKAAAGVVVAILAAAVFQHIAKQDAAALGLSGFELALLGAAASAFVTRAAAA